MSFGAFAISAKLESLKMACHRANQIGLSGKYLVKSVLFLT